MGLPDELWINGRVYDVEMQEGNPLRECEMGLVEYIKAVITINEDMELEGQLRALIHEAWHVFDQDINGEMDEKMANHVATFVHNLFTHNRDLADIYCTHGMEDVEE